MRYSTFLYRDRHYRVKYFQRLEILAIERIKQVNLIEMENDECVCVR